MGRAEASATKATARQHAKEELDLVDPGGMQRRVVEVETLTVPLVEALPALALVDVEVIEHDVDVEVRPTSGHSLHVALQVFGPARGAAVSEDFAGMDVHRCEQRLGTVPDVLEFLSRKSAGSRTPVGMLALDSLHPRLLVVAHDDAAGRWLKIQRANLGHLLAKQRIGAVKPKLKTMRLHINVGQDAMDATATWNFDTAQRQVLDQKVQRPLAQPLP